MRASTRIQTVEEQFCNWLQENGYQWPEGSPSTSHVSGLCRGRFGKILVSHLLETVRPLPVVRDIRDVLRRASETDLLKQKAVAAKLRHEALAPQVPPLETEYEQLLLQYQSQAELLATLCREVVEQEAAASSLLHEISNEDLQAAAMRASTRRLQHVQVLLQQLHSKLRNLVAQAKQRVSAKHGGSSQLSPRTATRQVQVVEGLVLQLWEACRQQVQLKQQNLLHTSSARPDNSTALSADSARDPQLLQQLAVLTEHCPTTVLQALTRIIKHQSARLLAMKAATAAQEEAGAGDGGKPQDSLWMPEVDMNLKSCHQESWQDLVDMEEAEATARTAEEKLAALKPPAGQAAVMKLQLKVAKLAARKAELEAELQQQRQRLTVMKAADAEAVHLQKQLHQTTATDILLLSASRALFHSATTGLQDFVTVKARQLAFMQTAQQLCQQVKQSLQYAANAVGREVQCARELPLELLNPRSLLQSPGSNALNMTAPHRAPSNLRRLRLATHALPAAGGLGASVPAGKDKRSRGTGAPGLHTAAVSTHNTQSRDSVAVEVVKAAAAVDPLLPLTCPSAMLSSLLELHSQHMLFSGELHAWEEQAAADAARLAEAEGSVAAAEKAHNSYTVQRAPALLKDIQEALAAGTQAVEYTRGPAMEALQDMLTCPAVHATPWQLFDGKSASQWVTEVKEARLG